MSAVERALDALRAIRRSDGWQNLWTRLGTALDKNTHTTFVPDFLPDEVIAQLFHGDDMSRLICSIYVEEALRRGWGETPELDYLQREKGYSALDRVQEAAIWGQAFGGGIAILGADDGGEPWEPLDVDACGPIRWIDTYDKRQIERLSEGATSLADAQVFRVTPQYGAPFLIHTSRCLVFGGLTTGNYEKERNCGWDSSIMQVVYRTIRDFNDGFMATGHMLSDASTTVVRMHGLLAALAGKDKETIETRAQLIAMTKSVARAVLLDAGGGPSGGQEDYQKISTEFSGVSDILDRLANRLASATRIPVTVLMGQAPAGLNATGESDIRSWYDRVESFRAFKINPNVEKLFRIAKINRKPCWPTLWQETRKEKAEVDKVEAEICKIKAETKKIEAETRAADIGAGIVLPEEVLPQLATLYPSADLSLRQGSTPLGPYRAPSPSGLPATNTPPALPPALPPAAESTDDEATTQDDEPVKLAKAMTDYVDPDTGIRGMPTCEHNRPNRCPLCGVERLRGFDLDPVTKKYTWRIAWRAIGRAVEPEIVEQPTTGGDGS